jgi:DNA-binding MarR family transcriptional regulator
VPIQAKNNAPSKLDVACSGISELESHLGFWVRYVSNHVSSRFQGSVEACGVSVSEWVALRQLFKTGACPPSELIETLGMTKGAVSKIVTRLQAKGLVERAAIGNDSRAQQVLLTKAGRKLVPTLASLADRNDEIFFGHLHPGKRDELMVILKKIVRLHQFQQVPVE